MGFDRLDTGWREEVKKKIVISLKNEKRNINSETEEINYILMKERIRFDFIPTPK